MNQLIDKNGDALSGGRLLDGWEAPGGHSSTPQMRIKLQTWMRVRGTRYVKW